MITFRLIPGLLANGITDIPELPYPDDANVKHLSKEDRRKYHVSLVVDRQRQLASTLRERMTAGQSYDASNLYRKSFYDEVITLANKVNFLSFPAFCENDDLLEFIESSEVDGTKENRYASHDHGWYISRGQGLNEAGERLCRFIDKHSVLESNDGPRRPLVVLAFDEAHVLTDNPPGQPGWNYFLELRRILRQFHRHPIFSLFLSTAGCFNQLSPEIRSDPSARAREPDNPPLDTITEISFDDLAYPTFKDSVSLMRVIQTDWICHLGRPLYVHPSYPFGEQLMNHLE